MALAPPEGFAIRRNGTCLAEENDCGATLAPFRACCPQGASCFGWHNNDCCVGSNCTQTLLEYPSCANSSWNMYLYGGYFCCAPESDGIGYGDSNSDGCAEPGSSLKGVKVLGVVSQSQRKLYATDWNIVYLFNQPVSNYSLTLARFPVQLVLHPLPPQQPLPPILLQRQRRLWHPIEA